MTAFVLLSLTAPRPTPTLPTPHYPLPCTIFLPYERSVGFASVQSLWAFNFGHPCPSLVKGELLLLSFVQPTIEGLPHRTLSSPQPLQKDNNPSPHVCPFIQYVNHSPVCSPAHSSAFGTASPQDRCKAPK